MKRTLLILGHPDTNSLCGALADAYQKGAVEGGGELRRINLGELSFDPILHKGYHEIQELEPALKKAQDDILWAEHLVLVYPVWWGLYPALLKGFLDRTLLPGFAFKYKENSPWWNKLLKGRSARLITTMDAPYLYQWFMYGDSAHKAIKKATLEFCGIKPVKITSFSQVKFADDKKRAGWIKQAEELGWASA
jgi:putative NADPH-quinone reductase